MAGVKQPLQDVLSKLSTIDVINRDANTLKLYTRVWNNQVQFEAEGELYSYPKPAAFVEVVNNATYEEIGGGFASGDIVFRVHIVHEYLNLDGTFEQDLEIFDLRDKIISTLSHYKPTACGLLVRMSETQQYDHENVYEYIIDFGANFTDSKGSEYDPAKGNYIDAPAPIGLQIVVDKDTEPINEPISTQAFRIPN